MQQGTLQKVHFAAPVGGINSVDPVTEVPDKDCIYAFNLVRAQLGMRSRTGYQEWQTGLTGGATNAVRTIMPYSGSAQNQANDKLFAVTSKGIYDCTGKGNAPNLVQAFPLQAEPAGYGVFSVVSTPGGRFLIFVDEVNGPFLYTEATGLWTAYVSGVAAPWQTNLFVAVGTQVINASNTYTATVGGTTAAAGNGPTTVGAGIVDGGVTWTGVAGTVANAVGPSAADQNNGLYVGANLPSHFSAVAVWKSRVWFVEKGSTRGWYLPLNSIFGQATSFDFGFKMKAGGPLVNLYNWSFDGGSGPDARLVAISTAGDVVIYAGIDPATIGGFAMVGVWSVGGVPYGRRIAIEYGGDILIASMLGLIPLSKLIIGNPVLDRTVYDTYKISNLFNTLAVTFQTQLGWAIIKHPTDNCILVNVPQPQGWTPLQFAMAFATRSWSQYRSLPIISGDTWNGVLYIGTADGRVCICQGAVDNVTLVNPAANQKPVAWSILTAFKGADLPGRKIMRQIRPIILSAVPNPVIQAVAKLDFDTSEPLDTSASGAGGAGTWDSAIWDQSKWGVDSNPAYPVIGAYGLAQMGAAVAIRGQAISYTTFAGADLFFEPAALV